MQIWILNADHIITNVNILIWVTVSYAVHIGGNKRGLDPSAKNPTVTRILTILVLLLFFCF